MKKLIKHGLTQLIRPSQIKASEHFKTLLHTQNLYLHYVLYFTIFKLLESN